MDNYNSPGAYALPPCAGCGAGNSSTQDIASYSYMNPIQKQNLAQSGSQTLPGMPGQQPTGSPMAPTIPALPSLEEIAGYSNMTPVQQQQQRRQLEQASGVFPGTPGQRPPAIQTIPGMPGQQPTGSSLAPITPTTQPVSIPAESLQYMNGFLRTQIGRPVKVDFLIGTNTLVDKTGILLSVGINYILLLESETDDVVACDFYNIKFIKFYY